MTHDDNNAIATELGLPAMVELALTQLREMAPAVASMASRGTVSIVLTLDPLDGESGVAVSGAVKAAHPRRSDVSTPWTARLFWDGDGALSPARPLDRALGEHAGRGDVS
jgi:hypothetical protein